MKVWVYPERKYEEFGAVRWEVQWYELTKKAKARIEELVAANEEADIDPDFDLMFCAESYKTEDDAREGCRQVQVDRDIEGEAWVQKQVVDWYVEEDRIAEWADVGDKIYVYRITNYSRDRQPASPTK